MTATPQTQILTPQISMTNQTRGSQVLGVVKDAAGAAIDISAWTFQGTFRPSNPNVQAAGLSLTGHTFTGAVDGTLTDTWTAAGTLVAALQGSYTVLGSSDSFATFGVIALGNMLTRPY